MLKELIEGGYIGQAIVATVLVVTCAVMLIQGQAVPEWLIALTSAVVSWYFRSQAQVYADHKEAKNAWES